MPIPRSRKLLIVEDDPGLQSQLKWCFDGFDLFLADTRQSALTYIQREKPQVVITDLGLPPDPGGSSEGFKLLEDLLAIDSSIKTIVVTGREEKENAVRAIGMGAYDFYQKPIDEDTLKFVVQRAFRLSELEYENQALLQAQHRSRADGVIGTSPEMQKIMRTVERVSATSVNFLILGESGTGKGLIAKTLHALSERSEHELVTIN